MSEAGFSQSLDEGEPSCFRSIAPVLKGLVKTGYNVYMTFYGSEFITVLFDGLQQRDFYKILLLWTVVCSVSARGRWVSFLPFLLSFSPCFLFISLSKTVSSETTIVPSNCSQTGQETNAVNPQCRRQPQESFLVRVILAFSQHASYQQEYLPCSPDLPKCGGTRLCILLSSRGRGPPLCLSVHLLPTCLFISLGNFFLTFMTLG